MSPSASATTIDDLIVKLFEIQAVKFGQYVLKSGISSPVYFDLRVIVSHPQIMNEVAEWIWLRVEEAACKCDNLCGVPYTALPIATVISTKENIPMLIRRKEAKGYGTAKMIEGKFNKGDKCLIIEDVVTSGSSVLETAQSLEKEGLAVSDAIVLLDREQGGKQKLASKGITLHSVCTVSQFLDVLHKAGRISNEIVTEVQKFVAENSFDPSKQIEESPAKKIKLSSDENKKVLSHSERAASCTHPLSKRLFTIMTEKKTNLAFSADVTSTKELLKLADEVGPSICLLKTHVDILEDFTKDFTKELQELADKHNFLVFEDRKFADIGNTVKHQYSGGLYQIADWAHITNAHILPGPGIIKGLKEVGLSKERGLLLLAEMSSEGNMCTANYTKECVRLAEENTDFVMGFICRSKLSDNPNMIHMTPGVQLQAGGDGLGQQYLTPAVVIGQNHCDVIIVGRGILKAAEPAVAAKEYQEEGYKAYEALLGSH